LAFRLRAAWRDGTRLAGGERRRLWAKILLAAGSIAFVSGFTLLLTSIAPMFAPRADLLPAFTPAVAASNPFTVIAPTPSVPGPVPEIVAPAAKPSDHASFEMRIPVLGFSAVVHQGVSLDVLARGPGHYPETPWPGQHGNVGVAGHNTFFLAFSRLKPRDRVEIQTQDGLYIYEITSSKIVSPTDRSVLAPTRDDRLTLTTCYPLWAGRFATQRLIFTAREIGGVA
jgi:LPXTG-site transpeptidase (sortase) family protein